jgi:hypothetical protein
MPTFPVMGELHLRSLITSAAKLAGTEKRSFSSPSLTCAAFRAAISHAVIVFWPALQLSN